MTREGGRGRSGSARSGPPAGRRSAVRVHGARQRKPSSTQWLSRQLNDPYVAEARRLVTHGPYARIRHPLYLGEEIALLGIALEFISPWAIALLVCQWAFQLQRMQYEEQLLKGAFPEYETYIARTSRLIPGVY